MGVQSFSFHLRSSGFTDVQNVTQEVQTLLEDSELSDGIVTIFVPGSTAGITTIEFESGAVEDLRKAVERMAPQGIHYDHDAHWGDGNGFAHVRAALLGPSLSIPVVKKKLQLGTWQQIVLVDFDNRPRQREVIVQFVGK